jgi:outer membrane protein assembly factor BamB
MAIKVLSVLSVASCSVLFASAGDWPRFRGPGSMAVSADPLSGPISDIAWKVELPGRGLSSPVVSGNRVFLTASSGAKQNHLHVLAFDTNDGKKLWERSFWATGPALSHPKSCMAAPTPVTDGRLVLALFATNDLVCLDTDGAVRWIRSLYQEFPGASDGRGLASSPVIADGVLIVQGDNQNNSFALGIDLATGTNRWKVARPKDMAWTTPIPLSSLSKVGSQPGTESSGTGLVLFQGATQIAALETTTGKEIWKLERPVHPIASAAVSGDMLYVPAEETLCAFKFEDIRKAPKLLWEKKKLSPNMSSPLVLNGQVFVIHQGMLVRVDGKTGEITSQTRVKGEHSSSPVAAGQRIYCFSETGSGQAVDSTGAECKVTGTTELNEGILCTPALADGALYVRSDHHLWKLAKKG